LSASRALSAQSLSRVAGWTLPVAFCLLFLSVEFQPKVTVGEVTVALSDVAVLAVAVSAALALPEHAHRLRGSRWLWLAAIAFLAFVTIACLYPLATDSEYDWKTHLVTAAKYAEYAVLAPAVVLLVRDTRALTRLLGTVAVWSVAAGLVAVVQFAGVDILHAWPAGIRQPSFAGIPDLGALGGAALGVGFLGLLLPQAVSSRITIAALVGGTLSLVLSNGVAPELGLIAAALAVALVARRRLETSWRTIGAIGAVTVVCGIGVHALRSGDLAQYARYVGLAEAEQSTNDEVQTYAQRQLMAYIGLRVWLDKPLLGAGWQSIRERQVYAPFLADAHRRFPDQPEQAFPNADIQYRQYGIDNAYIQALAELGAVGFGLFVALLGVGLVLGLKRALRAPPEPAARALLGLLWLLVVAGVWVGQGLVAGTGFTALSWLALGFVASGGSRDDA
jgi:O-antigen ligase